MLPSAVNDTMRDMMAQIRDCGDGIRDGTYTMTAPKITGGTITGAAFTGNTFTSPVISGGSINNTPIGATTANTGAFTTLSATGVTTVQAGTVSLPAITTTGDTNTGIFFPAADTIAFTEGGAEVARFDSSGQLNIGSTTQNGTTSKLYVRQATDGGFKGLSVISSASQQYVGSFSIISGGILDINQSYLDGSGSYQPISFTTSGSERMRIGSAGQVYVGTTTDGTGASTFIVGGNVSIQYASNSALYRQLYYSSNNNFYFNNGSNQAYISSAGAFTNASDARLKEEIVDIKYGIDDVMKMQPRNYQMKADKIKCVGFVAQELQTVIPECVSGDDEHYFGVDYGTLTAVLTSAIQELNAKVEAQAVRIAELEGAK
jgi:hypothetical protein